jgi:ketosteroid isomerase-like protein
MDQGLGRELIALEQKYWNAIRDRDSATATSLSSDPCVVIGAQGVGELDKPTLARMLEGASYQLKEFALDNVQVRRVTDDVAVVAYKVKEDLVVDGKDLSLEAFDSSVWVRRNGEWACVVHTESIAGDPFGRH